MFKNPVSCVGSFAFAVATLAGKILPMVILASFFFPSFSIAQGPAPSAASGGPTTQKGPSSNFEALTGGQSLGIFKTVVGGPEQNPVEVEPRSALGKPQQLPLTAKPGLSKLVRLEDAEGLSQYKYVWDWYKAVLDGKLMRRDVMIIGRSADGREIIRWLLRGALPEKLSGTPLNARAAAFSYSVSFSYQSIERQK